jgi:hypothetical protein
VNAALTPEQNKELAFADLECALSLVRTAERALQPLADADLGGENPGAELVAIDVMATLHAAAEMIGDSIFTIQRNGKAVST